MSETNHTLLITGAGAAETAAIVRSRFSELETGASCLLHVDTEAPLFERNSDFVYSMGVHDTPAFAAEKILDQLVERGWITLDAGELTPEEEAQIRARLQGLGYVD